MRTIYFFFMPLLLASCTGSKTISQGNFSGEIHYQRTFIPKNDTVNLDSLMENSLGRTTIYSISDSNYKSLHIKNGELFYSYTYDQETKRMYDYNKGVQYITYRDSRTPSETELDITINRDSTISILGFEAYQTTSRTSGSANKTYYSDAVRIQYSAFEGHEVGNWYERLKLTDGAISLKSIIEYDSHTEVLEAVKVVPKKFSSEDFELPEGLPIAASYTVLDEQVELVNPTPNQRRCFQSKILAAPDIYENEERLFTSYVVFVVNTNGKAEYPHVVEKDEYGLSEISIDIINSCNLNFRPGKIDGKAVPSESYLPVNFQL